MRVLLTNDDGIHAKGLLVLAHTLIDVGRDLQVVAPLVEASGSSAGTGAWHGATARQVPYEKVNLDLPAGVDCFGLSALPALCVAISFAGAFGPAPDCVVSGINRGRNVGGSLLHSGTVGAALTAANLGRPGVAFSIEARREEPHYETACEIGLPLLELVVRLPRGTALNLNVPDLAINALRGIKVARLGTNPVIFSAERQEDHIALARGLRHATHLNLGSDEHLTANGYATVTIVEPSREFRSAEVDALVEEAVNEANVRLGEDDTTSSYA